MTTQVAPVQTPIETVTPLRPSEALRLGRLIAPWVACDFIKYGLGGEVIGACALGAVALGYGRTHSWRGGGQWPDGWPEPVVPYPCDCAWSPEKAQRVVTHLNDSHGGDDSIGELWPTERIADWLAGIGL